MKPLSGSTAANPASPDSAVPKSIAILLETDGPGGAEHMILLLAEELRRRGWEVVPVGPARSIEVVGRDVSGMPLHGWLVSQFRNRGFVPETFTLRFPLDPLCALGMVRMLRRRKVQLLHSHEFTMAFYGAIAARWLRIPHVITVHGGTAWAERARRRAALRWACRKSTVVAVSRASAAFLESRLGMPSGTVVVVPNGVLPHSGDGSAVRSSLDLDSRTILILTVGNLYKVKGHDVLLSALARLGMPVQDPWCLAIAGRGEEEAALRGLVEHWGLSARVRFLGFRSDISDLLAAADLFIMPSRSESHPLALLEAMFAGLSIIASAVGGIPDSVRHDREALLVPPGDSEALAAAIQDLLSDPERRSRLGQAARERARAHFTIAAMADAYERIYRDS